MGSNPTSGSVDYTERVAEALSGLGDVYLVSELSSGMDLVCVAECEDCGTYIVTDPSFISLMKVDETTMGVTMCFYCERPMTAEDIPQEMVDILIRRGVNVLDWSNTNG